MNFFKINIKAICYFKFKLRKVILTGLLLIAPLYGVQAINVEPMVFELEPIGTQSSENIRIENPNSSPITMEITAESLEFDEAGIEINKPADDDFLIYPPQVIIQGGATQVVKVKFVGDPLMDKSSAYRIIVNQLPVNLNNDSSGVAIMSRFLTIVNVSPEKSKPTFNVSAIEANDESQWLLTVENTGNRFGVLSETSWEIESLNDDSKSRKLSNEEVNTMISRSLVLPKSTLQVIIPALEGYDPKTTQIKINIVSG